MIAGMCVGADSIDDLDMLRVGGMPILFDGVYAPSTFGTLLREFSFGHARQLESVPPSCSTRLLCPDARDDAAPAAAPSAPPVANANGQPMPGPTPASPPVAEAQASSRFGLNAQKLLDEVRSHGIAFSDDDAAKLVQIGDANVARNQPDLTADDPQIGQQLKQEFPSLTDDQAKIETSCLAEYVEREIARQHNTVPPDERDDHGG